MFIAGLSVAVAGGFITLICYIYCRVRKQQLVAPINYPFAKWNGFTVVAAFMTIIGVPFVSHQLLINTGFFRELYGADFPITSSPEPTKEEKIAATLRYMWANAISFPIQVSLVILIAWRNSRSHPFQHTRFAPNFVNGYLMWLLVTPAALSVFSVANIIHTAMTNKPPDQHPLTTILGQASKFEWALFVLQTVMFAPVIEELMVRGLLLPWLCQEKPSDEQSVFVVMPGQRSHVIMAMAVMVAAMMQVDFQWEPDDQRNWLKSFAPLVPPAFFLLVVPIYLWLPRYHRLIRHLRIRSPQHVRAIIASSALFAAFHTSVWPSPIPLLVLSIGISYLAVRTQSLVGPIVVHSLFNAVSAICLIIVAASK